MGVPGVVAAIALLRHTTTRALQLYGFAMVALAAASLAAASACDASAGVQAADPLHPFPPHRHASRVIATRHGRHASPPRGCRVAAL